MRAEREIGLDTPEITYIKVNVDGSMGVVLRDHIEVLVRAQAIWYRFAQNASLGDS